MKKSILLFFLLITVFASLAQDKATLAQAKYMAAEKAYNLGNYEDCYNYLVDATKIMGDHYKISYLMAKTFYQVKYYQDANKKMEEFFSLKPPEDSFEYNEMVKLLTNLQQVEKERENMLNDLKKTGNLRLINEYRNKFPVTNSENYEEASVLFAEIYLIKYGNINWAHQYLNWYVELSKTGTFKGTYLDQAQKLIEEADDRIAWVAKNWMTKNLDVDKFNNGEPIEPIVNHFAKWFRYTANYKRDKPASTYALNPNEEPITIYGKMYNDRVFDNEQNACPAGWHVATQKDWESLFKIINIHWNDNPAEGVNGDVDSKLVLHHLKSTSGWGNGKNGADTYGFSLLPGGCMHDYDSQPGSKNFHGIQEKICLWAPDYYSEYRPKIISIYDTYYRFEDSNRFTGYYIRCVKDAVGKTYRDY